MTDAAIVADRSACKELDELLGRFDPNAIGFTQVAGEEILTSTLRSGMVTHIAVILPEASDAERDFLINAARLSAAASRRIKRADDYFGVKTDQPAEEPKKRYSAAQNCGKWCNDRMFQRFMFECKGLDHPQDQQRMRTRIHSLLSIKSRADLDKSPEGAEAWHQLRAEFKAWQETKL